MEDETTTPETIPVFRVTLYWKDKDRSPAFGEYAMAGPSGPSFFAVTTFEGKSYMFSNDSIETIEIEVYEAEVADENEAEKPTLIVVGETDDEPAAGSGGSEVSDS